MRFGVNFPAGGRQGAGFGFHNFEAGIALKFHVLGIKLQQNVAAMFQLTYWLGTVPGDAIDPVYRFVHVDAFPGDANLDEIDKGDRLLGDINHFPSSAVGMILAGHAGSPEAEGTVLCDLRWQVYRDTGFTKVEIPAFRWDGTSNQAVWMTTTASPGSAAMAMHCTAVGVSP